MFNPFLFFSRANRKNRQLQKYIQQGQYLLCELRNNNKPHNTKQILVKLRKYKAHPQVRSIRTRILKELSRIKKENKQRLNSRMNDFNMLVDNLIKELTNAD